MNYPKRIDINGIIYEAVESVNESKWHDMTHNEMYGMNYWNLPNGEKPKMYSKKLDDSNSIDVALSGNEDSGFKILLSAYNEETDEDYEWGIIFKYNEDKDLALDAFEELIDNVSSIHADNIEDAIDDLEDIANSSNMISFV